MTNTIHISTTNPVNHTDGATLASNVKLTNEQEQCMGMIADFLSPKNRDLFFVLTGQAGTGKTFLTTEIIKAAHAISWKTILGAPTGRAAQVIGSKAGMQSHTIHHLIYHAQYNLNTGAIVLKRRENFSEADTLFIIDEASMVSDIINQNSLFECGTPVLTDLIEHAKSGKGKTKILFIGDRYQLPPVGDDISPALFPTHLRNKFNAGVKHFELKQVMRQSTGSPILDFATRMRQSMISGCTAPTPPYQMHAYSGSFYKGFVNHFTMQNLHHAVILCQNNKMVRISNEKVRQLRFGTINNNMPMLGDVVMVNQNYWGGQMSLFSGTTGIVQHIDYASMNIVENAMFATAHIKFKLNNQVHTYVGPIHLCNFNTEDGNVPLETSRALYHYAMKNVRKENRKTMDDLRRHAPYIFALQLRYGYAITGHKAQGGEWNHVYISPYYRKDDKKWIYTATTRAVDKLYSHVMYNAN